MTRERWHGTDGGYSNHKCRCRGCQSAHAAYMRRYRVSTTRAASTRKIAPKEVGPAQLATARTLADPAERTDDG